MTFQDFTALTSLGAGVAGTLQTFTASHNLLVKTEPRLGMCPYNEEKINSFGFFAG